LFSRQPLELGEGAMLCRVGVPDDDVWAAEPARPGVELESAGTLGQHEWPELHLQPAPHGPLEIGLRDQFRPKLVHLCLELARRSIRGAHDALV
jgi:hypothetical protein